MFLKRKAGFHAEGLRMLKILHSADSAAIPLGLLSSLAAALHPYIKLLFSAEIIDSFVRGEFQNAAFFIFIMLVLDFLGGLILNALNEAAGYHGTLAAKRADQMIADQAMTLGYDAVTDGTLLKKMNNSVYALQMTGGFNRLFVHYRGMFGAIAEIAAAAAVTVGIVFSAPLSGLSGAVVRNGAEAGMAAMTAAAAGGTAQGAPALMRAVSVLAGVPVSGALFLACFTLSLLFTRYAAVKCNARSSELFTKKLKAERTLGYLNNKIVMDYEKGKVIRLYEMQDMLCAEMAGARADCLADYSKMCDLEHRQAVMNSLNQGLVTCFAFLFVLIKILAGAVSIGGLAKYSGAIISFGQGLKNLAFYNERVRLQCGYLKECLEFLEMKNEKESGSIPIEKRNDNEYELEFRDVTFTYPGSSAPAVSHLSLKLKMKGRMAVVGRNGAGKTTFIQLLCRLYEPDSGTITLNGVDIRKYDYDEYLSLFGVVFQDFRLFAMPVDENVAAGENPDGERLNDALLLAGMKERVEHMEKGVRTSLYGYDEGGVEISGGEAQKLAIARALYKDAPIVILDEPTAALDPISEYEVYEKFGSLVRDKTSIYISHRMSSCRFCEDILVFENGRIVQRGGHEELLAAKGGTYARLWSAQAKYYSGGKD